MKIGCTDWKEGFCPWVQKLECFLQIIDSIKHMYLINKQTRLVLEWGFRAVKENNIWQVGVRGLTLKSLVSQSHFFCKYLLFFSTPTVLLRCTRGTFWKLIPGDLTWCFLTELTVPMQKMEGIYICLVKEVNQMSWEAFPSFTSTVSLPAQVSRENNGGEAAGMMPGLWAFGTPLQRELGVFLHASTPELSAGNTLCRISRSCWNITCSVSTFCRARLTLPCSLLRVRRFQSPQQPRRVIQACSGLRSCPLIFSERETCPPSACNCSLRCQAEPLLSHVSRTFDNRDIQTERDLLGPFGLSDQRAEHRQVSAGFIGTEDACVKQGGYPQQQARFQRAVIPTWGRSQPKVRCQVWWISLDFSCAEGQEGHLQRVTHLPSPCTPTWQGWTLLQVLPKATAEDNDIKHLTSSWLTLVEMKPTFISSFSGCF